MTRFDYKFPAVDRTLRSQAEQIARWCKQEVPNEVARIESLLEKNSAWYLLDRNAPATSCAEAANSRRCLGQVGIPLERELKSFLGFFVDEAGLQHRFAVHCRATHQRDDEKVKKVLQVSQKLAKADESELYGLVNPFSLEARSLDGDITIQIFDQRIFEAVGLPRTMMTNAGDRTWSVEFEPNSLQKIISADRFIRADVIEKSSSIRRPNIGILTGNSPESGALLLEKLDRHVRTGSGLLTSDVYLPKVYVVSAPAMGLTMELHLRENQVWEEIGRDIERLCELLKGEDSRVPNILSIACNTTPHFWERIDEIASRYNVRFISIADAVEDYLRKKAIQKFTLLGLGYVNRPQFSGYEDLFENKTFTIEPLPEGAEADVEKLARDVKNDRPINECSNLLNTIFKRYELRGKHVVVALTEISLILAKAKWDKNKRKGDQDVVIDAVELYAKLLADIFMGKRSAMEFS